jgi:hypothetical protein
MRITFAIAPENDSVGAAGVNAAGYRVRVPAVDLGEHCLHFWLALRVLRIPPIERAQWFVDRVVRPFRFGDQTQCQLMNEPGVGSTIARRIDRFFAPL